MTTGVNAPIVRRLLRLAAASLLVVGVAVPAWAQAVDPIPEVPPPPVEIAVPSTVTAVEMPTLPTPAPTQIVSLEDGTGMPQTLTRSASRSLPMRAATVFDRRWHFDGPGDISVSASFTGLGTRSQVGVMLGLPANAEQSQRGVACVVAAGRARLLERTGQADAPDAPTVSLSTALAQGIATDKAVTITLSAIGSQVQCAVAGQIVATVSRDGSELGIPGVWTAGSGPASLSAFQVQMQP